MGNIRKLMNANKHPFVLCTKALIWPEYLPAGMQTPRGATDPPKGMSPADIEKRFLIMTLDCHPWKKMATARKLGIDKNRLRRKLKRNGITTPGES
ncbi:MAG: hypothetical protein M0036_03080 [Desulfobacteraceae bacterium]|nr:hypothetical protein [Desulfobacteraceae bacterium]